MNNFVWRHFSFNLPDDWEMLQFSRKFDLGKCVFADRYQFRFEFNWRKVDGAPDFNRLISDYTSKLTEDKKITDLKLVNITGNGSTWYGFEGYIDSVYTTRYGRFFAKESCLIETVFLWPDNKKNPGIEKDVLLSFNEDTEHDGSRKWKCYGMDMSVSNGLLLEHCKIDPVYTKMVFESPVREEKFERAGMLSTWLKTGVKEWLTSKIPKTVTVQTTNSVDIHGHKIESMAGYMHRDVLDKVIRRKTHYETVAWTCPHDGRLYNYTSIVHASDPFVGPKLAGTKLRCCTQLK
jgi:hypothetical protein